MSIQTPAVSELLGELQSAKLRLSAVESENAELRRRLERLEVNRPSLTNPPAEMPIAQIVALTQEMFPGEPTIEVACDPEDPAHLFVVVTVVFAGDVEQAIEKRLEWHRRVSRLTGSDAEMLRLSMAAG